MLIFFSFLLIVDSRRIKHIECPLSCSKVGLCDTMTGKCICPKIFTGEGCEIRNCDQNCSGNGTCQKDGTCLCNQGFTGPICSIKVLSCPNNCTINIDVPNGECNALTGKCNCRKEFSGDDCSIFIGTDDVKCKNNCNGHGICDLYQGVCKCDQGFISDDCSVDLKTAKLCPNNCSKQGKCDYLQGSCNCRDGFTGNDCSTQAKKCPNNCSSPNGSCMGEKGCVCVFPFKGADCGQNTCDTPQLNMCNNNGQCSKNSTFPQGFCQCNLGTKWPDCKF